MAANFSATGAGAVPKSQAEIVVTFGKVIGETKLTEINTIINQLSESAQLRNTSLGLHRFTDKAFALNPLIISEDIIRSARTSFELAPGAASGTYGTCFKTADGNMVFKQIKIDPIGVPEEEIADWIEERIRGVYVEAFIQTILSSDPTVGHYITRPTKLYKSYLMKRPGLRSAAAHRGFESIELFIQMDINKYNFDEYLQKLIRDRNGALLTMSAMLPIWGQLMATLNILRNIYGFYHGDLHNGNVMFDSLGNLKLIDYGFSCLNYNRKNYRSVQFDETITVPCYENDLLLHLTSLIQTYGRYFERSELVKIKNLLNYSDGNFYDKLYFASRTSSPPVPAFHLAYKSLMPSDLKTLYEGLKVTELNFIDDPLLFFRKVNSIIATNGRPMYLKALNYIGECVGALCKRRPTRGAITRRGGKRTRKNRKHK